MELGVDMTRRTITASEYLRRQRIERSGHRSMTAADFRGRPRVIATPSSEQLFAQQLAIREHLPAPVRHWTGWCKGYRGHLDFAWPDLRLAVEIDGGAHRISPENLWRDREKDWRCRCCGIELWRFGKPHVISGIAVELTEALLLGEPVSAALVKHGLIQK